MTHDLKNADVEVPQHSALLNALRDLNDAAYKAIRAGRDTVQHPMLNREKLRQIARMTDEMVDHPNVET